MPDEYPRSVAEVLDPVIRFRRSTATAARRFARSRPWRGSVEERAAKFSSLHAELCRLYEKRTTLRLDVLDGGCSGRSFYSPFADEIVLVGRLSVITFLHEVGHVLYGRSELKACRWSLQLFKKTFPRSFSGLLFERHVARVTNSQP